MPFDLDFFISTLKKLMLLKGPSLKETARTDFIKKILKKYDLNFHEDKAKNIIINLHPGKKEETIIFDAHTDVAGKGYSNHVNLTEKIISGQGCADDLTAVVMLIMAAIKFKKKVKKPFKILLSSGEEGFGNLFGIKNFIKDFNTKPEYFISFDLSFKTISFSGLGSRRFKISVSTKGGHSFEDYGNPNACQVLCKILTITEEKIHIIGNEAKTTFNIGEISGGSGINIISDYAEALIEFRSISEKALENAHELIKAIIKKIIAKDCFLDLQDIGSRPASQAVITEKDKQRFLHLLNTFEITPEKKIMSTNINAALAVGWPSFCTGLCDSGSFHTEAEYVKIPSLEKGWNLLVGLMKELGVL